MSYATVKFQVAMYNRLGGDTITRNVTDGQTHRLTKGRLWYGNNIPLFPKKKSWYTCKNQTYPETPIALLYYSKSAATAYFMSTLFKIAR